MTKLAQKLSLVAALTVAGFSLNALDAQAATFTSSTYTLNATPTPFDQTTNPQTFNYTKFNSTGKTVTGVRAFLNGRLFGSVTFSNTGTTRQVNSYRQNGVLRAQADGGSPTLASIFPQQYLVDDGSNTSGALENNFSLTDGQSQTFNFDTTANNYANPIVAAANWSYFAAAGGGTSNIDWLGTAAATSTIENGVNVTTNANLSGSFYYEVDYSEVQVPESSNLLGVASVAAFGLLGIRRKKNA
jgi:hypothetical protein